MIDLLTVIPIIFIVSILSLSVYKYWLEEEEKKKR